jgi:hypothetical protein
VNSSPGQLACRALIEENSKNVCSAPIWTGAMGLVSPEEGGSLAFFTTKLGDGWQILKMFETVQKYLQNVCLMFSTQYLG